MKLPLLPLEVDPALFLFALLVLLALTFVISWKLSRFSLKFQLFLKRFFVWFVLVCLLVILVLALLLSVGKTGAGEGTAGGRHGGDTDLAARQSGGAAGGVEAVYRLHGRREHGNAVVLQLSGEGRDARFVLEEGSDSEELRRELAEVLRDMEPESVLALQLSDDFPASLRRMLWAKGLQFHLMVQESE